MGSNALQVMLISKKSIFLRNEYVPCSFFLKKTLPLLFTQVSFNSTKFAEYLPAQSLMQMSSYQLSKRKRNTSFPLTTIQGWSRNQNKRKLPATTSDHIWQHFLFQNLKGPAVTWCDSLSLSLILPSPLKIRCTYSRWQCIGWVTLAVSFF